MSDLQLQVLVLVGVVIAASVSVFAVWSIRRERKTRNLNFHEQVSRDWLATGRINLGADQQVMEDQDENVPADFVLRIEENRLVNNIAGLPHVETRWRPATKKEAKIIVQRYHQLLAIKPELMIPPPEQMTVSSFDVLIPSTVEADVTK